MAAPPPPPRAGGLSLYDNLTDPNDPSSSTSDASATISSAPVLYHQQADPNTTDPASKKPLDAALRFQPIRRPQPKQPNKPKGPLSGPRPPPPPPPPPAAQTVPPKSSLADWAPAEEDEWLYGTGEKRQRGGRKRKKKKQEYQVETDWDELYDPARPTNIEEYLRSDEKVNEVREWKALLYRHRTRRDDSSPLSDDEEDSRPPVSNQFAPPPSYNNTFAPPPLSPPPAAPPAETQSGDDAYARRLNMTQPPPPPPPTDSAATISAAPIRYEPAPEPEPYPDELPPTIGGASEPDTRSSSRPGQAGFAARLMGKYGWTKGSGLGADSSGMVNPLRVQVEKRRKKADADGGGWAEPGGKGKIIGGGSRSNDTGKFGAMSEVIVLRNMLEGMPDLQEEISDGLGQEIGEECGEKYGRVERLYIDQENRLVFIKFTNQVSALRAVNELEGRVFNGNTIAPGFYDLEKFDNGIYT